MHPVDMLSDQTEFQFPMASFTVQRAVRMWNQNDKPKHVLWTSIDQD